MRIIRINNKGWRARFDDGFDEENLSRIADAFGYIWAQSTPGATIYVGYDTRLNGRRYASLVGAVVATYGLNVIVSSDPCPTPAVGWATFTDENAAGAIILTASSAEGDFGGISARSQDGGPISDEFYDAASKIISSKPPQSRGAITYADILTPYLENLVSEVDADAIREAGLHIVVDPLYGAARSSMAKVLRAVGCRVNELHGEELADFAGLRPVPQKPWVDQCEHAVRTFHADMGFVFDSDADRLGLVDEKGNFVEPHRLAPLILEHLVERRDMDGRVVANFSSSALVKRQADRLGCEYTAVPMGFTRIHREIIEGDVLMATEQFGGVCVPEHLPERDGLMAALLMVESVAMSRKTVSEMVDELENELGKMYYVNRDIDLDASSIQAFRNILPGIFLSEVCGMTPVSVGHSDGLVLRFADDSWVQLRPSRTDPVVRASAEAPDPKLAEALGQEACKEALRRLPIGPWHHRLK